MHNTLPSRLATLDIIRGIALLGILVMNVQSYTLFTFLRPEQVYQLGLDTPENYPVLQYLIQTLVQGQFYTIYSFLFGLGFYMIIHKPNQPAAEGNRIFKRRLWTLLLFGLVHAFVFWFGDILHKYALLGFTLLYFNKKTVPTTIRWILVLVAIVVVFNIVKALFFNVGAANQLDVDPQMDAVVMEVVRTWQHGSVFDVFDMQWLGVMMMWIMAFENGLSGFIHFEIMFLLGLIVGKLGLIYRIASLRPKLLRILVFLLPAAIVIKGLAHLELIGLSLFPESMKNYEDLVANLSWFIGTLLLTAVYLIVMFLAFDNRQSRVLTWIANTGRLGLTNYLMQTVLCMLLFYGYAIGLSGKLTLWQSMIAVLLIYAFQVLYSNWYLKYDTIGPMEKLWRKMSYGTGAK